MARHMPLVIAVGLLLVVASGARSAPLTQLSRGPRALLPVVVGAGASAETRAAAAELASMLARLSGAAFAVEAGDGSQGLAVGRPADFARVPFAATFGAGPFEREAYRLVSHANGLCLLGASDLAVSHAVWDLLYRLGHRQFFPGARWEVVPAPTDLAIAVDERVSPSFHARRIWYNWGFWGYNEEPYRQWCRRNRAVQGFQLNSGHAYQDIIANHHAEFEAHPEYLPLIGGKRMAPGGDAKFCVANAGLRQLVVDDARRRAAVTPRPDSISMEPSDGDNWCECAPCTAIGSPSNRAVLLANAAAEAINAPGQPPCHVGLYAYNRHSAPPTLKVHPRVIISATTAFIGGGLTFDQVVTGWQAEGAEVGVYDYLSVVDWDWNLPRGAAGSRPHQVAAALARFHQMGARFYDAESGDCWGPCGLGYYVASRVMWDVREAGRVDALITDFVDRAFGTAREPMREFYRLINEDKQRRAPSDLVGRMYRQLDAARRATVDPAVQARLEDLVLYTRHAELYYAHQAGKASVDDVARHAYRIRTSSMVHSYGLWSRLLSQQAALTAGHPLKNDTPYTTQEVEAMLANGMAANQPVESGFAGVAYSRRLVPATPLKLGAVPRGDWPSEPQDHQRYWIWVEQPAAIDLKLRVQKVWANRMPKISLFSPQAVTPDPVASDESYRPDGQEYAVSLTTPHAGLHRVETWDGGDFTRITWPAGMPVTIESGIDTPDVASHFRGGWSLCFYVPRGTKVVGGWAARVANWAPRVSGQMLDGDGKVAHQFAGEDGWFAVPVPPGQDGRLWRLTNSVGQRLLMTVPPYLARSGEELLLPEEVVAADRAR